MMFQGLIAAAHTPFTPAGELDEAKIPAMVEFLTARPLAGLFVNGTTGEFSSMTDRERARSAEAFVRAGRGKLPVIVHTGSPSVKASAEFAAHAQEIGADAVATVAPFYFKPAAPDDLVKALAAIAAAAHKLPFYYYHIPALTGVNFAVAPMIEKLLKAIPNFAGVKFTYENLMDFSLAMHACGGKAQMLFGRDEILLAGLSLGAVGGVGSTYNYAPKLYAELIAAFTRGDLVRARELQLLSQQMIKIMCSYPSGAGKCTLKLAGFEPGPVRQPLRGLTESEQAAYFGQLRDIGFTRYL